MPVVKYFLKESPEIQSRKSIPVWTDSDAN